MPVSKFAREKVVELSGGMCELLHDTPVEGSVIMHKDHAGMGGMPEGADCNDPDVLMYGCIHCHDTIDGRLKENHPIVVEFSRSRGVLEMVDEERRKISHDRIFFHQWPVWREAVGRYPLLVDAIRRRNEGAFDLAKELAFFSEKGSELFRVCPEVKQMPTATFWTFVSLIGMTSSAAKELIPIGKWVNSEGMESARGIDMDALDALRQAPEEDVPRLIGLTARLPEFFAEVDKVTAKKHGRRTNYMTHNEETGEVEDLGLLDVEPDVADTFGLIKGRFISGREA